MTNPPDSITRLLAALGARVEFREPLLGDMAEEFEQRLEQQGRVAARRWYLRESLRAAPHLFHDWPRGLREARMLRQAGLFAAAYALTSLVMILPWGLAWGAAGLWGVSVHSSLQGDGNPLALALLLVFGACGAVTGGYVSARLDVRAPLASALLMGTIWSCVGITASVLAVATGHEAGPLWYRIVAPIVLSTFTSLGGVLQVHRAEVNRAPVDAAVMS